MTNHPEVGSYIPQDIRTGMSSRVEVKDYYGIRLVGIRPVLQEYQILCVTRLGIERHKDGETNSFDRKGEK